MHLTWYFMLLTRTELAGSKDNDDPLISDPDSPSIIVQKPVKKPPAAIKPIPREYRNVVEISSAAACRNYANVFIMLNPTYCGPRNIFGVRYDTSWNHIYSWQAKPCKRGWCHAKFECKVIQPYRGCPVEILQAGLAGQWTMTCSTGLVPWIAHAEQKHAFLECITREAEAVRMKRRIAERIAKKKETSIKRWNRWRERKSGSSDWMAQPVDQVVIETVPTTHSSSSADNSDDQTVEDVISNMLTSLDISELNGLTCLDIAKAGSSGDPAK